MSCGVFTDITLRHHTYMICMLKLQMTSVQKAQIDAQQTPSSAGGDWGTLISFLLGTRHSDHCKAIHTLARAFPKLRHPWHVAQLLNHRLPILNKVNFIKCTLCLTVFYLLYRRTCCNIMSQTDLLQYHVTSFKTQGSRLMQCVLLHLGLCML